MFFTSWQNKHLLSQVLCSWREHKSTSQRAQIIFGFKWETLSWLCSGGGILWLVWVTLSPQWKAYHSPKWVEYAMPFRSKKLKPHLLQKVVLWGGLGKNVLWWLSSHLNKHELSMGLSKRALSGRKAEKPWFSSLEELRGIYFLQRAMTPFGPDLCLV